MGSVTNESLQSGSILFLYRTARECNYFTRKLKICAPEHKVYPVRIPVTATDLMPLYKECCRLIETCDIKVIINRPEDGVLLLSALSAQYPIRGPSIVASFLTNSKRYTREIIAEPLQLNMAYAVLLENDQEQLQQVLASLPSGEKVIAKPIFGSSSKSLKLMVNKNGVLAADFLASLPELKTVNSYLMQRSLISNFLKNKPYNPDQGYMIELYAEKDPAIATFHGVDGLIYNKSFIPWCIRDHMFWKGRRECHIGNAFPTSLAVDVQERVWKVAAAIAERMIQYGFDHQFFEAELIVFKTGKIALMEINGRLPLTMTSEAYADVLIRGEPTATILAMAEGRKIKQPTIKKGVHGVFAYMAMLNKGKISDVVDLDKCKQYACVEMNKDGHTIVDATARESGMNIGFLNMTGKSRLSCLEQAREIITDITKDKESSPWFDDEYLL